MTSPTENVLKLFTAESVSCKGLVVNRKTAKNSCHEGLKIETFYLYYSACHPKPVHRIVNNTIKLYINLFIHFPTINPN